MTEDRNYQMLGIEKSQSVVLKFFQINLIINLEVKIKQLPLRPLLKKGI